MRLIDADVLVDSLSKRYNEKVGVVPDNLAEGFVQVEKLIKEQPLAYDLNNVVEEIKDNYGCGNCEQSILIDCNECWESEMIDGILEIVKAGGVDEMEK